MKKGILQFLVLFQLACTNDPTYNITLYHNLTNEEELLICNADYLNAIENYKQAFDKIQKPFGHDIFNAALASQMSNQKIERDGFIRILLNNSDDLDKIKSTFVGPYITDRDWNELIKARTIKYNPELRIEFKEIQERDQLFRPMYETHDDTINANRIINMNRILELTEINGFPSHFELGFTESMWGQNHDIVLHHTTQRRSTNKNIIDLKPILFEAVSKGRFDPEKAIFYLNMQNDTDKQNYETYSTQQYLHPQLPDSLTNKIWLPNLTKEEESYANQIRTMWNADLLKDIAIKSSFKAQSELPFIFTSVRKSTNHLSDEFDSQKALDQYKLATSMKKEFKLHEVDQWSDNPSK